MPEQSTASGAVFLSYASEDADAAARISEALRAAGVDVWFDRNELRGGDSWDAQIRKHIHDCALFVPLISAHTNARKEGYFRGEWNLAVRRLINMSDDAGFLLPVVIDDSREKDARVPEEFLRTQWTWLSQGETSPAFVHRVLQLLGDGRDAAHEPHGVAALPPAAARTQLLPPSFSLEVAQGRNRVLTIGIVAGILVATVGTALWVIASRDRDRSSTPDSADMATAPSLLGDPRPSVAVLPFSNRSKVEDDAYFVDGVHDDILTQLSKVSGLRVISRTSVEKFRSSELSIRDIATQLGVKSILEGGVQRAGDRVRINVQLIDAATDTHLWADTFDRELVATNIFSIQSEIATAVAGALKTALTTLELQTVGAIQTESLAAWEAYQLGKRSMSSRNTAGLAESEAQFRKAIKLDPNFALAWTGLADTIVLQYFYAGRAKDSALTEALQAAKHALRLDVNLSEAWAAMGNIESMRYDEQSQTQGELYFRRAIKLNPNNATAYHWLGWTLAALGRRQESLVAAEHAIALDPLSSVANNFLGQAMENLGRFEDAIAAYKQSVAIQPDASEAYRSIGTAYYFAYGHVDEALPWLRQAALRDEGSADAAVYLALAFWELCDDVEAKRWIDRSIELGGDSVSPPFMAALYYLTRGDYEASHRYAEIAARTEPTLVFLLRDDYLREGNYREARKLYEKALPKLFTNPLPSLSQIDYSLAIELATVLQRVQDAGRVTELLAQAEKYIKTIPRMGSAGYGLADVQISALRGHKEKALVLLREAERAGWRTLWRYARDFDPALESIRSEPEFKAVFADIERDVARQRTRVVKLPQGMPVPTLEE